MTGITPKMAIRFASFEQYKALLANKETGKTSSSGIFFGTFGLYPFRSPLRARGRKLTGCSVPVLCSLRRFSLARCFRSASPAAGLGAGVTEAVLVVCPMEVVKIRLQAQVHSMTDPLDVPKYRNAAHALWLILREEGPGTLYRGVALTALRQATNQGTSLCAGRDLRASGLIPLYHGTRRSRQLYGLHGTEAAASTLPASVPGWCFAGVSDLVDRSHLGCRRSVHQRPDRHNQVSPRSVGVAPYPCVEADSLERATHQDSHPARDGAQGRNGVDSVFDGRRADVPGRRPLGVLQGYHAACRPCRSRTSRRLYRVRADQALRECWRRLDRSGGLWQLTSLRPDHAD